MHFAGGPSSARLSFKSESATMALPQQTIDESKRMPAADSAVAAYTALGYAQASGRAGVYAVVLGPGFFNTTAALSTAHAGAAPVLALISPGNRIRFGLVRRSPIAGHRRRRDRGRQCPRRSNRAIAGPRAAVLGSQRRDGSLSQPWLSGAWLRYFDPPLQHGARHRASVPREQGDPAWAHGLLVRACIG